MTADDPLDVVVAGGDPAALEATLMALRDLAGDRVRPRSSPPSRSSSSRRTGPLSRSPSLALMTAREGRRSGAGDLRLEVISPEGAPLGVFGPRASDAVAAPLAGLDHLYAAGELRPRPLINALLESQRAPLGRFWDRADVRVVAQEDPVRPACDPLPGGAGDTARGGGRASRRRD